MSIETTLPRDVSLLPANHPTLSVKCTPIANARESSLACFSVSLKNSHITVMPLSKYRLARLP